MTGNFNGGVSMTQADVQVTENGFAATSHRGRRPAAGAHRTRASQWACLRVSNSERDILVDAASLVSDGLLADQAKLAEFARGAWDALEVGTRDRISELATGISARPELHVSNLPVDPILPPTPTMSTSARSTITFISELVMTVFATALGNPMSYADQRGGSIFHDVFPTVENAAKISSHSSLVGLGFHSEMFFHPTPPAFLILNCLRVRPGRKDAARTGVVDLGQIEALLGAEDRKALRSASFALDLARLHGSYRYEGNVIAESDPRPCIPVIADDSVWRFRFEPALMTPVSEKSRRALDRAEHAAEMTAAWGTLHAGEVLLVDNRRSAHSRSPFVAKFDGADRWLRRTMVASFEMPTERGVVWSTDFDLWTTWHQLGVMFDVIPYAPEAGE